MDSPAEGFIGLSAALEVLRTELDEAWTAGEGKRVRFRVSELNLTVQVVARHELQGGGKLRWYVLEAGASATSSNETMQTLVLTLTPGVYDEKGKLLPLDVGDDQRRAGD
ncbi:MAG: trypco2 family protein [Solirubrobacteraceae bacterium]